jgi:hypothetical protein
MLVSMYHVVHYRAEDELLCECAGQCMLQHVLHTQGLIAPIGLSLVMAGSTIPFYGTTTPLPVIEMHSL